MIWGWKDELGLEFTFGADLGLKGVNLWLGRDLGVELGLSGRFGSGKVDLGSEEGGAGG